MKIEQYVMAYAVEQDRLRAILPQGFTSLRPVLRINAEIAEEKSAYVEFNTAAEKDGKRGWLNIGRWENTELSRSGSTVTFKAGGLEISFTAVDVQGSCPVERDNCGCWFLPSGELRPSEEITANKEFCDCGFSWNIDGGAQGRSIGKTLPAVPTEIRTVYPKAEFTVKNAAIIPCEQVLGAYVVCFER